MPERATIRHGARSTKQAIAIGLSKARRSGVALPPPKTGMSKTRESAARASRHGRSLRSQRPSARRSRAVKAALRHEGRRSAARKAARTRTKNR